MKKWEREFMKLAGVWMACRLAAMGGTPVHPLHRPVRNFETLAWAILGSVDYAGEMRELVKEVRR